MIHVRQGWSLMKHQFPSVIILFLYQLLWGVFLYRLIDTAVTNVLLRYPNPPPNGLSRILFLFEGQLNLGTNPDVRKYMWLLLGMAAIRLLLTPFIQAGIFYGLTSADTKVTGLPLFRGMKEFGKPVVLFYLLELVLILLPSLWIVPRLTSLWPRLLQTGINLPLVLIILGYILGWLCYGWIVHQCVLFTQFGYLFKTGVWNSLLLCLRYILQGMLISLILAAFGFLLFLLCGTASWIWTGIVALILQQTYPLIRSTFKIWKVTSQYNLWQTKTQKS